jgi:hypothetical protein
MVDDSLALLARPDGPTDPRLDRRAALRRLAVLGAGLVASACAPMRVVLHLYPEDFDESPELTRLILGGFVTAVIPGASEDEPNLTRALTDPAFPLARCAGYLAADLCKRSAGQFGTARFDALDVARRTEVIKAGLSEGGTTSRIYNGAIFLTQIAYYAGIYDDDRGCPLIEWEGRYRFRGLEATTYPNPGRFLARALSADGNPA